jgi:hypothetical protein
VTARAWPVKIRAYPEGGSLHVTCYVWPTKRAMRAHARRTHGPRGKFGAYCSTYRRVKVRADGTIRTSPQFGEVHFSIRQMGSETVTHEFTHAAWGWARRVGWKPEPEGAMVGRFESGEDDVNEERFCYALGAMVRQFIDRAYRLGLYDPKDGKQ